MIEWLAINITQFFSNLFHNILVLIVVRIIGLPVLISWATGTLAFLLQAIKTPVPIWAVILLALLVSVYLKIKKTHSSSTLDYKTKYFTIGNFKWETKIYNYGGFEVDKYPICTTHDLKFISGFTSGINEKYCPGTENETCINRLSEYDEFKVYKSAKSIIENKVRNKKY